VRYPDERETLADPRQDFTQFGESKVAQKSPQLSVESQNGYREETSLLETVNAGSQSTQGGLIKLTTGTNADDSVKLATNQSGEYGAGKEGEAKIALAVPSEPVDDAIVRWGYYNDDNGIFTELRSDGLYYIVRRAGTDREVGGSNVDVESRVLPGEITYDDIDMGQLHIWGGPFSWYAAGGYIGWSVELPRSVSLRRAEAHEQFFAKYFPQYDSQVTLPYINTPNLPLTVELINDPATSTAPASGIEVLVGGRQFSVIGKQLITRQKRHHKETVTVGTSREPVFAIRPKATFNGRENGVNVRVTELVIATEGNVDIDAELGGSVTDSYSEPPNLTASDTAAETAVNANGTLTEDTGGKPANFVNFVRADAGGGPPSGGDSGRNENIQPLGIEQALIFYAEAESAGTDITMAVQYSEPLS
jgi:hypothetical protein